MKPCEICKSMRAVGAMTALIPTRVEIESLRKMGDPHPNEPSYLCKPCASMLSKKATSIPYMKGRFQMELRSRGVPAHIAERAGDKYAEELSKLKPKD